MKNGCISQPRQCRCGIAVVDRMGKLQRLGGEAALLWTRVVTATPHYVSRSHVLGLAQSLDKGSDKNHEMFPHDVSPCKQIKLILSASHFTGRPLYTLYALHILLF